MLTNHFLCMSSSPTAAKQDECQASWRCSALLPTAKCNSERIINIANAYWTNKLLLKHFFFLPSGHICLPLHYFPLFQLHMDSTYRWSIASVFKQLVLCRSREKSKFYLVVGLLCFYFHFCKANVFMCHLWSDDDSVVLSATEDVLQHSYTLWLTEALLFILNKCQTKLQAKMTYSRWLSNCKMTTGDFAKDEQLAGQELDFNKFIFSGESSFEL